MGKGRKEGRWGGGRKKEEKEERKAVEKSGRVW